MKNSRYLFRGKKLNGGDWVIGQPLTCDSEMFIVGDLEEACEEYCSPKYWYAVNPDTVGQCIGYYTDNSYRSENGAGGLTFEHDICEFGYKGNRYRGDVIYDEDDCTFCLKNTTTGTYGEVSTHIIPFFHCYGLKIIGNIHDNPELLKN